MVLKPDQVRVCTMLKDTITLLCRNGLQFKSKFCVEAIIGVTLDDQEMFHISMNEIVKSAAGEQESEESDASSTASNNAKRKRKKKRVKRENDHSGDDSEKSAGEESDSNAAPSDAKRVLVKGEPVDEDDDSGDLVFVKQEMEENWQGNTSNFPDFSDMSVSSDQNFSAISNSNYSQSHVNNTQWMQQMSQQGGNPQHFSSPRGPRTATVTGGGTPVQPGDPSSQSASPRSARQHVCKMCGKVYGYQHTLNLHMKAVHLGLFDYNCHICGKGFLNSDNLKGHLVQHTGEKPFQCEVCNMRFTWRAGLSTHMRKKHGVSSIAESPRQNMELHGGTMESPSGNMELHDGNMDSPPGNPIESLSNTDSNISFFVESPRT